MSWPVFAQTPIRYTVDLSGAEQHELIVTIEFTSAPDQVLQVRMPRASPGRYALHNFAKNVYGVQAFDRNGKPLEVSRATPHQWNVAGHEGYVRFRYNLYGNHADGTYSGIDNRKAHLNMPATFAYGVGMEGRPVELQFDLEDFPDWTVATQLKQLAADRYRAPDYYYFYDSPTIIGDFDRINWTVTSGSRTDTIELAILQEGTRKAFEQYAEWTRRIVAEQQAVFGELPAYDYGKYTFLLSYNPYVYGDGMEHRNSTICTSRGNLADDADRLIGTVSHEFFHCWNVERLRPQSLEPFDFDRANMSGALWFAEGFTSYYDDLILCRAGIRSPEEYVRELNGTLNYVINSPGRQYRSPVQMSYYAPFTDAATAIDENNETNTFVSYYSYGAVIGLALDLSLRTQFDDLTLDDYMQHLWQQYGATEVPYQLTDLERALGEVTQDPRFAELFFDQYVYHSNLPDLKALLQAFGVRLDYAHPDQPGLYGLKVEMTDAGAVIKSRIPKNNPLYEAGVTRGDTLLFIDDTRMESGVDLTSLMKIGLTYTVRYRQNGKEKTGRFTAQQDPTLKISLMPNPSPEALERRQQWLSSKR